MSAGAAEAAAGPTRTLEEANATPAAPTLPPFPDPVATAQQMPVAPLPPPGPFEAAQTTLDDWKAAQARLTLDEWMVARVQAARVDGQRGPLRPASWEEAAAQGLDAFADWLRGWESLSNMAEAVALGQRISDEAVRRRILYDSSYGHTKAQPEYQTGRNIMDKGLSMMGSDFDGGGDKGMSAAASAGAGVLVAVWDILGTQFVKGPRTGLNDPLTDVTGDSFGRLPLELRLVMSRAAARLPPWPHEDVLRQYIDAKRLVGPGAQLPLLRLAQEAKRRGLWPEADAQWPLMGNTRNVAGQLRAMIQVALEVEAAAAGPGPAAPPPAMRPRDPGVGTGQDFGGGGVVPPVVTTSNTYDPQPGAYPPPPQASAPAPSSAGVIVLGGAAVVVLGGVAWLLLRRKRRRRTP